MSAKKTKPNALLTVKMTGEGNRAFDADGNQLSDISAVTVTKPADGGAIVTLHLADNAQSIEVE